MFKFNKEAFTKEPRLEIIESKNYNFDVFLDKETDIIYSSGSVIEGYGDKFSDVDIYFLCENNTLPTSDEIIIPKEGTKIGFNVANNEEFGFYVEFILNKKQWGLEVIDKINLLSTITDDAELYSSLSYREKDFYYRLAIGIPLYNENMFFEYTKNVSKDRISLIISRYNAIESSRLLSCAKLLYEDKSYEHACYYAQEAVYSAIDSYLAINNEPYQSYKLRFRKLAKVVGKESSFYRRCVELSAIGTQKYVNYINKAVDFCEELGIKKSEIEELTYKFNGWVDTFDIFDQYLLFNGAEMFKIDAISKIILKDLGYKNFTKQDLKQIISSYNIENVNKYIKCFIDYFEKCGVIKLVY